MRVRELNHLINYTTPPSIEEMLNYDLWELHEAVFVLTEWPDYIIKSSSEGFAKIKNIPRNFLYEPSPSPTDPTPLEWKFIPSIMGRDFLKVYEFMRQAIFSGELPARIENLGVGSIYGGWEKKNDDWRFVGEWVSYLLTPHNVIQWAFIAGVDIPEKLQKRYAVHLRNEVVSKATRNKVRVKITGQLLRKYYPGESEITYCVHKWMSGYVSKNTNAKDKYRVIRNALNELRDPNTKVKQGNITRENKKKESYLPRAIEEVIRIDPFGNRFYHLTCLRIAMETALGVLFWKYLEDHQHDASVEHFSEWFMKNEVIALYAQDAPKVILDCIRLFEFRFLRNLKFVECE